MHKMVTRAAGAALFAAATLTSGTAFAATGTGQARANIVSPITVAESSVLDFGTIITTGGATNGTVLISTNGTRTCGVVTCTGGTPAAGAFNVTGSVGSTVSVSLPATVTLRNANSVAMTATLSSSLASANNRLSLTNGTGTFSVGAELTVAGSQQDGAYTGTYTVTVDYV